MLTGSSFVPRAVTLTAAGAVALLVAVLALLTATWPGPVALAVTVVGGIAVLVATGWGRPAGALGLARTAAAAVVALVALAALAVLVSLWPATVLLAAVVVGVLVLAWQRPGLGLAAALALFGFEGSVKILLGLEHTPLPGGNRGVGAFALDLALFGAVAIAVVKDRLRTPRAVWASATRLERWAIGIALAWLALSVVQVAQGGEIGRGIHGFRLFQAYTLVALGTLIVFAQPRVRPAAIRVALAVGLLVSLYAAARVLFGPAHAEETFAVSVPTVTRYGDAVRAIGSFSSAVGLSSFLTPVAVFALVLGFLVPRHRRLAWAVAALAVVGLIGSYSRTSLFGVALGVACGLALVLAAGDMAGRRRLVAAGLVLVVLGGTYAGVLVASKASPALEERAEGILHPFSDPSVRLRFENWERMLDAVAAEPLGQGVGAVGGASSVGHERLTTTDNSFLKVLVEQGVFGFALFVAGFVGLVVGVARRLQRVPGDWRAVGLAALAGFVAFMGIAVAGEAVEQPGKVAAWALLGVAAAAAWRSDGEAA